MMKKLFLLTLLVFFIGCASAPRTVYLNNETIPGRVYTMNSTGAPISTTTLFYATVPVKDIDNSKVTTMAYLPVNENLKFSRSEFDDLFVRMSVTNPQKTIYTLKYNVAITYADGTVEGKNIAVGRSALEQRTFTVTIPVPQHMSKASFFVYLENDRGQELLRIGTFKYEVKFPHISKPIEGRDAHTQK